MPYVPPTTVASGGIGTSAWGNSVKAATDFLANPPTCNVYRTVAQSIPNATVTAILFDAERHDTDGMHSTATNTTRVTFNTAGIYIVSAGVGFVTNGTGVRVAWLATAGVSTNRICEQGGAPFASDATDLSISTAYKFAAGDFIELYVYQASGAALNTSTIFAAFLSATWIGLG